MFFYVKYNLLTVKEIKVENPFSCVFKTLFV